MRNLIVLAAAAALLIPGVSWGQGKEVKDCAECPAMVEIPAGKMQRSDRLGMPEYTVDFAKPFLVGKYEVTWDEFDAFRDATKRDMKGCTWYSVAGNRPMPDKDIDEAFDPVAVHIQSADEPVVCVSFEDAEAYAKWLSEKTGKKYRLLSEAEWEYAARAGAQNNDAWWVTFNTQGYAKMNCGDCDDGEDTMGREDWLFPFSVGTFPPNAWGVHDMGGNAGEWVQDCFNASIEKAPRDGTAWLEGDCNRRIVRGGNWHSERVFLAGYRTPTPVKLRINDIGFRIARSLD